MNTGTVTDVINMIVYEMSDFIGLIFGDMQLWQIGIGYYILGFILLGIVIDYILR